MYKTGMKSFRGVHAALVLTVLGVLASLSLSVAGPAQAEQTSMRAADPSVIRVGGTYVSVQSTGGGIAVRQAPRTAGLASAPARQVWSDTRDRGEVWAPEIVQDGGRYYIYFSAGRGAAHRMYVISSASPDSGYTAETKLALPDDKWAIDGTLFTFNGQRWFVWSGWAGDTNVEQNLYIARMSSPTTPTGARSRHLAAAGELGARGRQPVHQRGARADQGPQRPTAHRRTPPTAAGATSTAWPTCACGPAATRRTCGTGTSPTAASSAPTARP